MKWGKILKLFFGGVLEFIALFLLLITTITLSLMLKDNSTILSFDPKSLVDSLVIYELLVTIIILGGLSRVLYKGASMHKE